MHLRNVPSNSDTFVKRWVLQLEKGVRTRISGKKNTRYPFHENLDIHREAVARYVVAPTSADVDGIIDMTSDYSAERYHNQKMFLKIISNIRHLAS